MADKEGSDRQKGVIHGRTFRFGAPPPALDRLPQPLVLPTLAEPALKTLIDPPSATSLFGRVKTFLLQQRRETPAERLERRMREALGLVRTTMVTPPAPDTDDPAATGPRQGKFHRPRGLEHPYQLKQLLDLIPDLPNARAAERKYFEGLLFMIIQQYKARIAARHVWNFHFFGEAQQYFHLGDRIKRQIKNPGARDDVKALCQLIHDNYFHGLYYYMCSIYVRETIASKNTLFLEFCAAYQFLARLDWDGSILEQPNLRRLPSRNRLLYFAMRDHWVLKQVRTNYDYARQFKEALSSFPIEGGRREAQLNADTLARKGRARIKRPPLRTASAGGD
ncbi:MAG: hypothetical protein WCO00_02225 [Rhodospirillaceae bacterium]